MRSNIIFGTLLLLFSLFFYWQAMELPSRSAMFPRLVLIGMGITGLLMIIEAFRRRPVGAEREEAAVEGARLKNTLLYQIAVPGAIMLAAYGLLTLVGFYITAACLVFVVYAYHAYRVDPRSLGRRLYIRGGVFAGVVAVTTYLIFTVLLGLPAPSGLFI